MRQDDIQLEPPLAIHADVTPAVEDRTYLGFVGAALLIALTGGFVIATALPLIETGALPGVERTPRLIQAHGWAQVQGWAGLFVAGMSLRLIPRFAGRKPIPARLTLPILAALVFSAAVRTGAQPFIDGRAGEVALVAAGLAGGAGMAAVAAVLAVTLRAGRGRGETWKALAMFGAAWWAAWAVYTVVAALRASGNGLLTPLPLDETITWIVMLAAIGNFVWAVQSRSVPVFFGRKVPPLRRTLAPALALNGGVLLIAISQASWGDETRQRVLGIGLAMAGIGTAALAPVAGSLWGKATRLRPRARSASRFVIAANWWAVVAGVLLIYAGSRSAWSGQYEAFPARDAARHALGAGLITMLIPGMAQLIAPIFALGRAEGRPPGLLERLPFWLLLSAAILRVAAALSRGHGNNDLRLAAVSLAGVLAWLGLSLFAIMVLRALRAEPRMKALLADSYAAAKARQP